MRTVSRYDAIKAINSASGISDFDRLMLLSLNPNQFNYSDKDLAARWFLKFGEIISVNGSHIADLLSDDIDKAREMALEAIQKAMG